MFDTWCKKCAAALEGVCGVIILLLMGAVLYFGAVGFLSLFYTIPGLILVGILLLFGIGCGIRGLVKYGSQV